MANSNLFFPLLIFLNLVIANATISKSLDLKILHHQGFSIQERGEVKTHANTNMFNNIASKVLPILPKGHVPHPIPLHGRGSPISHGSPACLSDGCNIGVRSYANKYVVNNIKTKEFHVPHFIPLRGQGSLIFDGSPTCLSDGCNIDAKAPAHKYVANNIKIKKLHFPHLVPLHGWGSPISDGSPACLSDGCNIDVRASVHKYVVNNIKPKELHVLHKGPITHFGPSHECSDLPCATLHGINPPIGYYNDVIAPTQIPI